MVKILFSSALGSSAGFVRKRLKPCAACCLSACSSAFLPKDERNPETKPFFSVVSPDSPDVPDLADSALIISASPDIDDRSWGAAGSRNGSYDRIAVREG